MAQCKDFQSLKKLVEEGELLGLDFSVIVEKIDEYIEAQNGGKIKIVLLGSFSDGKTTAIAGLLGKVEDNMKIDEDESSDELTVFHIEALGNQYEIVDTPGLFGTKEKEIEGTTIRFSEITEKYISEAHIIIYVCNSVNTLKDSHKEIIKRVMRDYNKLASTIFVINKMDDVADTNDEEEYAEVSAIKRETFVERLKQVIGLTPEEEDKLNIACIAANPKAKGLGEWLKNKNEYVRRSHISQLEQCVKNVVENSDIMDLKNNTDVSVSRDLAQAVALSISSKVIQLKSALSKIDSGLSDMESDLAVLKVEIVQSKRVMTDRLNDYKKSLYQAIENLSSLSDMGSFLESEIGISNEKVDFNVLIRYANQIMSECAETNHALINAKATTFEREFNAQKDLINGAIKGGLAGMRKVNGGMVLKARDIFFKGVKFKPWGAIKLARKIGAVAAALGIIFDGWNLYKKYKNANKLDQAKKDLKDALNGIFKQIYEQFDQDEAYFKNFAPSYIELKKAVESRKEESEMLASSVSKLGEYKSKIEEWYGGRIEDASFEEI